MKFLGKLSKAWYCYAGLFLFQRQPVVILSPGRTGSMALHHALQAAGCFVFKVEFAGKDSRGTARFAERHILYGKRKAKIIVLYRDHLDMMITYFYSKAVRGWIPGAREALERNDVEQLLTIFTNEVLNTDRSRRHLDWYTIDLPSMLGLTNEATKLPTDATGLRSQSYTTDQYEILCLNITIDDVEKVQLLTDFIHPAQPITLQRLNTSTESEFASVYKVFKKQARAQFGKNPSPS